MSIIEAILVAVSLCADCFAVSLCSSVTIKKICWSSIIKVAIAFAIIQTGLLTAGWLFGNLLVGVVNSISKWIGFALLLYVGGSMLIEGIKGEEEVKDLNGLRNVIIGGVATSIDALAVGAAQSMNHQPWSGFRPLMLAVFVVTALSVITGIFGGKTIGSKFGTKVEIAGGVVLIAIAVLILV